MATTKSNTGWLIAAVVAWLVLRPKQDDSISGEKIKTLYLHPVGRDSFNRQVYKSKDGFYFKDIEDVAGFDKPPKFTGIENLTTAAGFEGEPAYPLRDDIEIVFLDSIGKPNIRYEFANNKELNDFIKNNCKPKNGRGRRDYEFSLNG